MHVYGMFHIDDMGTTCLMIRLHGNDQSPLANTRLSARPWKRVDLISGGYQTRMLEYIKLMQQEFIACIDFDLCSTHGSNHLSLKRALP